MCHSSQKDLVENTEPEILIRTCTNSNLVTVNSLILDENHSEEEKISDVPKDFEKTNNKKSEEIEFLKSKLEKTRDRYTKLEH